MVTNNQSNTLLSSSCIQQFLGEGKRGQGNSLKPPHDKYKALLKVQPIRTNIFFGAENKTLLLYFLGFREINQQFSCQDFLMKTMNKYFSSMASKPTNIRRIRTGSQPY